ncbi:bifunctional proline dehydrogenase/L-glutamate gamma-semialdehyde dehydrogenase [Demequina sp. NBRC 110053]|uniref:bifunctional proline dehydrogenase/L-glutamate gamma-semialdehyde dehydrogenase n=1 Tax=Demequina sp. NBRC 110053 TaxID=1570342 RepID=UPI0009FDA642|nr:bifunctional proline dehydrogenase/L-glutamate gamma-semialdehyde dehydrogenase [Demequina sp. NBRC 110053]
MPRIAPDERTAADADVAVAHVRRWLAGADDARTTSGARVMSRVLARQGGLRYLTEVVDGVLRPEDPHVAAWALRRAAQGATDHLPRALAVLARLGGVGARFAPRTTVAVARRFIRAMVTHLVADARPRRLAMTLRRLRAAGVDVNVNLLGEAVLGGAEAARRLAATRALIAHPDVDYVSVKVSAAAAPHSPWDFDGAVKEIVATLGPLYEDARDHGGVFVNLDMEEYRDLDLTIAVFEGLMRRDDLLDLGAGIVLQAYLPESSRALARLQALASERVDGGGAPLRVRVVKGANLSMERVEAELRDWPLATWHSKVETDAQYKRLLDAALMPDRSRALKVGIAGHNLFDIAHAWELARSRRVEQDVHFEMLLGMGEHVARAVSADVGRLRMYTPVVDPRDFDVALAYLVRRLEEVANPQNFLSRLATIATDGSDFAREEAAFREALTLSASPAGADSHREHREPRDPGAGFRNASDSDPSCRATRAWGSAILARAELSDAGVAAVAAAHVRSADALEQVIGAAHRAGRMWGDVPPAQRADVLERAADALEARRAELIEVMVAEAGKTIDQADPEVSEAIDFARYYARAARALEAVEGAQARPRPLTAVIPPWNFPVAIPAGSTLAALAAGSAVILKPAPETARCSAVLAEALWKAGVPREVLTLLTIDADALGERLVSDERVSQVILTGAFETAELFLEFRDDLRLFAETSGKNAMIVTPSADLDLAARDLAASAFGHAGQKCSAASLAILVGSVAESPRFRRQLQDAVRSLRVGRAWEPRTQMGPVIDEPQGKLLRGLSSLEPGETWWVEPERLGDALWTPGVRGWVEPGSFMHRVECFGPVLGIMRARDLDHAVELVNQVDFGLTSGIHTLDGREMRRWIDTVHAGNLYVNRSMTGAIVQRQPFGGWKRSVVGPTSKAGGPHYVASLTDWDRAPDRASTAEPLDGAVEAIVAAATGSWVRAAAQRDARAWRDIFSRGHDPTGMRAERNIQRYVPAPALVRWDGQDPDALARVCAAQRAVGGPGSVSAPIDVPAPLADAVRAAGGAVVVEDDDAAIRRARAQAAGRVRHVGAVPARWRGHADLAIYDGPVTGAAELELLPFLHEQAISITAHRYGTLSQAAEHVAEALLTTGRP